MLISDVVIGDGRRPVNSDSLESLKESIGKIGLLQPIVVSPEGVLVAGLHRVEACKALGWAEIPATVIDVDDIDRQLAEIDENLIRNELTALERGRQLARRKELYLARHPETARGTAGANAKSKLGKTEHQTPISSVANSTPSFVDETVSKTGRGRTTIQFDVQVGSMPDDVLEKLKGSEIENNQNALLGLARKLKKDPGLASKSKEELVSAANEGKRKFAKHAELPKPSEQPKPTRPSKTSTPGRTTVEAVQRLVEDGLSIDEIAEELGIHRSTVFSAKRALKDSNPDPLRGVVNQAIEFMDAWESALSLEPWADATSNQKREAKKELARLIEVTQQVIEAISN